jgi:glycosyltransferase involved in cell wall biosynthesis
MVALRSQYCSDEASGYAISRLCRHMAGPEMDVELVVPAASDDARRPYIREAVPPILQKPLYALFGDLPAVRAFSETLFLRRLRPGDIAYLWTGVSQSVFRRVKDRGHPIVLERINCHRGTARRLLDEAFRRAGLPPGRHHGLGDGDIAGEREKLALADFVFAPSPMVRRSLLENGVPDRKIIRCSYGWDPAKLSVRGTHRALPPADGGGMTVLFAGTGCLRKGLHLLLEAWDRSGLGTRGGRLVIAGQVLPEMERVAGRLLDGRGVTRIGYTDDIGSVYRSADVFAFPSLEEGGPMVTYEAAACGLPLLVSPMGAGCVARHGIEGLVLDPYDVEAWADKLRRLAEDAELRRTLGAAARRRADDFTWEQVGRRRRTALLNALEGRGPAAPANDAWL